MLLRRPPLLLVELRQAPELALADLLSLDGAGHDAHWIALAPHLGREVRVDLQELAILQSLGDAPVPAASLAARFGQDRVDRLLEAGLLLGEHAAHAALRARAQALDATAWWAPASVAQVFSRWQGVHVGENDAREGRRTVSRMIEQGGLPPPEALSLQAPAARMPLPPPARTSLDELLAARSTCRNFDTAHALPLADLATMLHRVYGAQAQERLAEGAVMLKKNSPSGGGLHPVEAFVLVQNVEGLAPGLYHYHCVEHRLDALRLASAAELADAAIELVAGQSWFANAPVLVLMAARFQRNFWKYRGHAKAWKVVQLDAGHLSQNLYLSATELGYGAFVTGAINDECAERLFALDGLATGAIAVCGFGRRAPERRVVEFDPLGKAAR